MLSNRIRKDELIELFKEMKLTQKKCDEGIKIYEEKYENKLQNIKSQKVKVIDNHKQPLRPYFIFQRNIMNKFKDKSKKIKRSEIGRMWKDLNDNEREEYINIYEDELKKYNEKFNIIS